MINPVLDLVNQAPMKLDMMDKAASIKIPEFKAPKDTTNSDVMKIMNDYSNDVAIQKSMEEGFEYPATLSTGNPTSVSNAPKFESNGGIEQAAKSVASQNLKYSQGRQPGTTDCSAFTQSIYKSMGKSVGGDTLSQLQQGKQVDKNNLQYGDAVFFDTSEQGDMSERHTGIYLGNDKFVDFTSDNGGGVRTSSLSNYMSQHKYIGARRY